MNTPRVATLALILAISYVLLPHSVSARGTLPDNFVERAQEALELTSSRAIEKVGTTLGKRYVSEWGDLSIMPPKGWKTEVEGTKDDYSITFSSRVTGASIIVASTEAEGGSLDELTDVVGAFCEVCGYEILNEKKINPGSPNRGYFFDVRYDDGSDVLRQRWYLFVENDRDYFVVLTAREHDWKTYKTILEKSRKTFRIQQLPVSSERSHYVTN